MWCPKRCRAAPDLYLHTCHPAVCHHQPMQLQLGKSPKDSQEKPGFGKIGGNISMCFPCMCFCSSRSVNCSSPVAKPGLNSSVHIALVLSIVYLFSGWFISCWAPVQIVGTQIPVLKSIPCYTAKIHFLLPAWGWTLVHEKLNSNMQVILHTAAL